MTAAAGATCPIVFAGLWTERWFRILWVMFMLWIVLTVANRPGPLPTDLVWPER